MPKTIKTVMCHVTWESNILLAFLRFTVSSFNRLFEPRGLLIYVSALTHPINAHTNSNFMANIVSLPVCSLLKIYKSVCMSIRDFTRPASSTESEDVYEGHRLNDDELFEKLFRNNTHDTLR